MEEGSQPQTTRKPHRHVEHNFPLPFWNSISTINVDASPPPIVLSWKIINRVLFRNPHSVALISLTAITASIRVAAQKLNHDIPADTFIAHGNKLSSDGCRDIIKSNGTQIILKYFLCSSRFFCCYGGENPFPRRANSVARVLSLWNVMWGSSRSIKN